MLENVSFVFIWKENTLFDPAIVILFEFFIVGSKYKWGSNKKCCRNVLPEKNLKLYNVTGCVCVWFSRSVGLKKHSKLISD